MNDSEYRSLVERDIAHMIHPQYLQGDQRSAIIFAKGEGAVLTDVRGREYIDGLSSLWNVAVGHGRKELAEAAAQQMSTLAFANGYTGYTQRAGDRAGGEAVPASATRNMDAVFFANSGSEANEVAFKLARFYWFLKGKMDKVKIIARRQAYHGGTLATTAATGIAAVLARLRPPGPDLHPRRPTAATPSRSCTASTAPSPSKTRSSAKAPTPSPPIIAEPVQGAGGVIPPGAGLLPQAARDLRPPQRPPDRRRGDHRLRPHRPLVRPATLGRPAGHRHLRQGRDQRLHPALRRHRLEGRSTRPSSPSEGDRFMHGFTNSAHPAACAVALRNLQIFEDENLVENAASLGAAPARRPAHPARRGRRRRRARPRPHRPASRSCEDNEKRKPFAGRTQRRRPPRRRLPRSGA